MTFLLDTNVVSEVLKPAPDPKVLAWVSALRADEAAIAAPSLAELLTGIRLMDAGKRRDGLLRSLQGFLEPIAIWPFDRPQAALYAVIFADRRKAGRPIQPIDAQIAAIGRAESATVVTRNIADFEDTGVQLLNPWEL